MDTFFIPFIILMACIIIARYINNKAMNLLSQEKKAELMDLFSDQRLMGMLFPLALLVLLYGSMKFNVIGEPYNFIIYFVLILLYAGYKIFTSHQKLKAHHFEVDFRNQFLLASAIRILGIMSIIAFVV